MGMESGEGSDKSKEKKNALGNAIRAALLGASVVSTAAVGMKATQNVRIETPAKKQPSEPTFEERAQGIDFPERPSRFDSFPLSQNIEDRRHVSIKGDEDPDAFLRRFREERKKRESKNHGLRPAKED